MAYLISILLGLCVGSFLNVVIFRFTAKNKKGYALKNIDQLRSQAPCCHRPILWFDLIPIFSWVCLRGRCRFCGEKISYQYILIELLTAALFFLCVWKLGFTFSSFYWMIFFSYVIVLGVIDLKTFLLPNKLTLSLGGIGLTLSFLGLIAMPIKSALLGATLGYCILYFIDYVYFRIRKKHGLGEGDFKLLAALGCWLGWESIFSLMTYASIMGMSVMTLISIFNRKTMHLQRRIPFGPFLTLAALCNFIQI
ncbi:MAG: hypothetical protein RLZ10_814 [Bacteroidota bacterium]|jgi:leader peptidase (prepilin peptidase)/N-methyltransferase